MGLDNAMFDARIRPLIDRPLQRLASPLVQRGVTADQMTLAGLAAGLLAGVTIAMGYFSLGLGLIVLSRLADGLDGAIASQTTKTEFGGYLDIVADFAFYAVVPLGFAVASPDNAVAAAALLAGFILSGVSFLAFAILAAKQGITSELHGSKSFYYAGGLAEGAETIALFVIACLKPGWFPWLAYGFSILCVVTAVGRTLRARRAFGP